MSLWILVIELQQDCLDVEHWLVKVLGYDFSYCLSNREGESSYRCFLLSAVSGETSQLKSDLQHVEAETAADHSLEGIKKTVVANLFEHLVFVLLDGCLFH